MTALTFADPTPDALPLHLVTKERFGVWLSLLDETTRAWVEATNFSGGAGETVLFPGPDGTVAGAAGGLGSDVDRARTRFLSARVRTALPAGPWRLATELADDLIGEVALGWLFAGYTFGRYRDALPPKAVHLLPFVTASPGPAWPVFYPI